MISVFLFGFLCRSSCLSSQITEKQGIAMYYVCTWLQNLRCILRIGLSCKAHNCKSLHNILHVFCNVLRLLVHNCSDFTPALHFRIHFEQSNVPTALLVRAVRWVAARRPVCFFTFHHFPTFSSEPSNQLFALFIAFSTPAHLHLAHTLDAANAHSGVFHCFALFSKITTITH